MSWLADIAKKTQDIPIANLLSDRLGRKPSKQTDAERDELLVKIEILTARNNKLQDVGNIDATQMESQLSEEEVTILQTIASEDEASDYQIAAAFDYSLARAQYHLTRRCENQYLVCNTTLERQSYLLDKRGHDFLAANSPA